VLSKGTLTYPYTPGGVCSSPLLTQMARTPEVCGDTMMYPAEAGRSCCLNVHAGVRRLCRNELNKMSTQRDNHCAHAEILLKEKNR